MKESYGEGLATHTDPESCVIARKGEGEALTGARAGWVLSREIHAPLRERRAAARRRELLPLGGQRRGVSRKRGGTPMSAATATVGQQPISDPGAVATLR